LRSIFFPRGGLSSSRFPGSPQIDSPGFTKGLPDNSLPARREKNLQPFRCKLRAGEGFSGEPARKFPRGPRYPNERETRLLAFGRRKKSGFQQNQGASSNKNKKKNDGEAERDCKWPLARDCVSGNQIIRGIERNGPRPVPHRAWKERLNKQFAAPCFTTREEGRIDSFVIQGESPAMSTKNNAQNRKWPCQGKPEVSAKLRRKIM